MSAAQILISGRYLSLDAHYGDVEMSTCWPGGSDQLTWTPGKSRLRWDGGEAVAVIYGDYVWNGTLLEPDPSQEQLTANGLWRLAENYVALDGSGLATAIPNLAIDQAAVRPIGPLPWSRPNSISSSATEIDLTQGPASLAAVLDAYTTSTGNRWGVDRYGTVLSKPDDTSPSYQTLPIEGTLGFSLDNYASTLIGRYFNGTTYATTPPRTDAVAEAAHGHREAPVDLTPKGTLTLARANAVLDNLLALGRATPQWTNPIELSYGEILTMGGVPVALETVRAQGNLLRVHGGWDLAERMNGQMYLDIPIGRTQLAGGTLTITPANTVVGTLADAITAALTKDPK